MRFLSGTAPRFPLPECDCPACECSYNHYADRRSGFDRRRVIVASSMTRIERRLTRGRRSKDAQGFDDPQNSR
jgi:phosphoribosyl 1,2-cyclic phosphodiesterase